MKNLIISISDFLDYVFNYKLYKEEFDNSLIIEKGLKDHIKILQKAIEEKDKNLDDLLNTIMRYHDLLIAKNEEIKNLKISNTMLKKNRDKK